MADDPDNLLINGGAESGNVDGWLGLEDINRGILGVCRNAARSGDYAFIYHGPPWPRSELVAVDTSKTYEVKAYLKNEDASPRNVLFGVFMYDKQQRLMKHWNAWSDAGTRTELTASCASGDKVLQVRDAAKWKAGVSFAAAFGGKENEPNFDVTSLGIAAIEQEGAGWKIILKNPCNQKFPAGTELTMRRAGNGGLYFPSVVSNDWTEIKGTIKPNQWWPGTAYVSVFVASKSEGQKERLLMDDFSLKLKTLDK